MLRDPVSPPARRRRRAGGREAGLVHGPGDARVLRAAVRRADREGRPAPSRIDARASAWRPKPATFASRRRSPWTCRPPDRIAAQEFARVDANPGPALASGESHWKRPGGRNLALYALERAARRDAAGVRAAWEKQRGPPAGSRPASTGTRGSLSTPRVSSIRSPRRGIARPGNVALSDAPRAWRVRAALRAGRVAGRAGRDRGHAAGARRRIRHGATGRRARSPPPAGRAEAAAIHAATRRRDQLLRHAVGRGDRTAAGGRAARRSSADAASAGDLRRRAPPCAARSSSRSSTCGRSRSASGSTSVRGLPDEALLVAAEYARREGLYDRAINTAERNVGPARFRAALPDAVPPAVRRPPRSEHEVDAALLFGIARQESRFVPGHRVVRRGGGADAADAADGAMGRETAEASRTSVRRRFPIGDQHAVRRVLFQVLVRPARAHAGARGRGLQCRSQPRAGAWRAGAPLEGAVWVGTIPFNETRDYVKKVLANAMIYARALDQTFVPLTTRLGTVPPPPPWPLTGLAIASPVAPRTDLANPGFSMAEQNEGDPRRGWQRFRRPPCRWIGWSKAGERVVGPTRTRETRHGLSSCCRRSSVIAADVNRAGELPRLARGASAVINLVGILNRPAARRSRRRTSISPAR